MKPQVYYTIQEEQDQLFVFFVINKPASS